MHTYQIRVNDDILTKFLWLLEYFKKDIEIIEVDTPDNNYNKRVEESKRDIEQGNIKTFNFDDFEKKLG
ncbi:hypothetical protein MNB_SV-9-127 [hydrothermal vent metagenome]|uniref:Uncharacterized protein n=1 Tax=hydrothermal vent metagenome TaxID=652676 RepID=A0A1W1BRX4_9ZZZZ